MPMTTKVITISAPYGAGGSIVGPAVGAALNVPFLNRMVPAAEQERLGEAASESEHAESLLERVLSTFAAMPESYGMGSAPATVLSRDEAVRRQAESALQRLSETTGGVVLGWGAAAVLKDAFHVRLRGPQASRVRQGARIESLPEDVAKRRQEHTDRARALYLKRLYGLDWNDLSLYHMVLDSTVLPLSTCSELVLRAADAFWSTKLSNDGN